MKTWKMLCFTGMMLASVGAVRAQQKQKFKVLAYLYKISGKYTIAGTHNKEPNATPARWSNKVDSVSGHYPGLWSGDFLFQQDNIQNRQLMIDEAIRQWNKGAVVNMMAALPATRLIFL